MIIRSGRSRSRSTVAVLAVAALTAIGAVMVEARSAPADAALAAAASPVEDEGADCPVPALPDAGALPTIAKLPDPFTRIDGSRISSVSDWRCRREEIKKQAEKYVYGTKPAPPASVTGTVSATNITVNVTDNGKSASFSASVSLPSGTGPFPAVVVYGGIADTTTIRNAGAAVINYDPYSTGKEGTGRSNKQGAFYTLYGATSTTGLLQAWGWGVSRIIDVITKSGGTILKPSVGVTGCSRFGKGSFVAGVFDQRVALTMPIESGTAGVPIFRGVNAEGAQTLSSAYGEQPWFGDAFSPFTSAPTKLPVDTHEMVAMVAPRGLFIMENPHIANLGPKSGSVAALGGAEVYKALGAGANITYWSDVANGSHCAVRPEWTTPLTQNIQKFLVGTGNAAGSFHISSSATGNLADWRTWTTPTLNGDTNPTGGPTTPPPTGQATTPPPTTPPPSTPGPATGCTATYRITSQWTGGFQGEVAVQAGNAPINGWTVRWTFANGQTITQTWNGTTTTSGSAVTVKNVSYNASVPANGTTTFGFLASWNGTNAVPAPITCTSP